MARKTTSKAQTEMALVPVFRCVYGRRQPGGYIGRTTLVETVEVQGRPIEVHECRSGLGMVRYEDEWVHQASDVRAAREWRDWTMTTRAVCGVA